MDCRKQRGELFRRKRELRGMSREKIAEELRCSREAVRLWETGERNPTMEHTLLLCRILDIKLDELDEAEKPEAGKVAEDFFREYRADQLIRESKLLTVSCKKNRIYLQKNLREQFSHSVEISIHPNNERELLLREKSSGKLKNSYYSARLVRKISQAVQVNDRMHFLCIRDKEQEGWRGILLPEMSESFLWENLRCYAECSWEDTTWKQIILQALYRNCWDLVEREEIDSIYRLVYQMAVCSHLSLGKKTWYLVLMYSYMLLGEIKRIQRRCRRAEFPVSLNQVAGENSESMLLDFWSGGEIPYFLFEIEEFVKKLTGFERVILRWLMQGRDLKNTVNFGPGLKAMIGDGICRLKEKAANYYGRDYIQSYFERRVCE